METKKKELTLWGFKSYLKKSFDRGYMPGFIMGPAPLDWLSKCALLRAKCLNVGITLWWIHGMTKKNPVVLTTKNRCKFAIGRSSLSYALDLMEKAGLVEVERHVGRAPRVTMLWDGINEQKESSQVG